MTNIRIDIASEFKDKGFKAAEKRTRSLTRRFDDLSKTARRTFISIAGVQAIRKSVTAFLESEKQAQRLRTQLAGINLEFASPMITKYMNATALATGKASGELSDAFVKLSQATGDVTTAQELLQTALDISAATGMDLGSISIALQRAYKGQTSALTRLNIGFTKNNLQGKRFDEILAQINKRFGGAQAAAAGTFAVKVERLSEAVQQAKEAFGEGFVRSLDNSKVSIDELQTSVINLGKALGSVAALGTSAAQSIGNAFTSLYESVPFQAIFKLFEQLTRAGGFIVTGELIPSFDATAARKAGEERRANEIAARNDLRRKNALLKVEKKISDNKKTTLTNEDKLKKASAVFDLQKIQIEAALKGKISDEERTRLLLMKAIEEERGADAEALQKKLEKLQADTLKLSTALTSLKAGDPFADWNTYFAAQFANIDKLKITLSGLAAAVASELEKTTSKAASAATALAQAKADKATATDAQIAAAEAVADAAKTWADATAAAAASGQLPPVIAADAALAAAAAADAATAAKDSADALAAAIATSTSSSETLAAIQSVIDLFPTLAKPIEHLLTAEPSVPITNDYAAGVVTAIAGMGGISRLEYSDIISTAASANMGSYARGEYGTSSPFYAYGMGGYRRGEYGAPSVVVNVAGSVTTQTDLAEAIRDSLYEFQRTGGDIRLSAVEI